MMANLLGKAAVVSIFVTMVGVVAVFVDVQYVKTDLKTVKMVVSPPVVVPPAEVSAEEVVDVQEPTGKKTVVTPSTKSATPRLVEQ